MHIGSVGTEDRIGAGGEVFCLMQFLASIDHSGCRGPTAAVRPYSRLLSIQQSTNILGNMLVTLKLEKVFKNNVYWLVQGSSRQRIIKPDVRQLRWPCRANVEHQWRQRWHIYVVYVSLLPSRPACSVCHAGHVRGLGS